jgi:hypothetical protein
MARMRRGQLHGPLPVRSACFPEFPEDPFVEDNASANVSRRCKRTRKIFRNPGIADLSSRCVPLSSATKRDRGITHRADDFVKVLPSEPENGSNDGSGVETGDRERMDPPPSSIRNSVPTLHSGAFGALSVTGAAQSSAFPLRSEQQMRSHISRTIGIAVAGLMLATAAQAQGKGNGKQKAKAAKIKSDDQRRRDGVVIRESNGDIVRVDRGRRVPPGLAKKPGQMPPGQYKKRYEAYEGASVLGDIMRRRGYTVLRTVPVGDARYVYYRYGTAGEQRAVVRPGTDRLLFSNVPSTILQAVLSQLY